MRYYRDRKIRRFSRGITIAYLSAAISFGGMCCAFGIDRAIVKNEYMDGKLSRESYIRKCGEMQEREEKVLKTIAIAFGVTFLTDVASEMIGSGRE